MNLKAFAPLIVPYVFMYLLAAGEFFCIALSIVSYLRFLPTVKKVRVGRPLRSELVSGAGVAMLGKYVSHGKFDLSRKAIWLSVKQTRAPVLTITRGGSLLPTKWILSPDGRTLELIEIKMPMGPVLIVPATLGLIWYFMGPVTFFFFAILFTWSWWKGWKKLRDNQNGELNSLIETLTI